LGLGWIVFLGQPTRVSTGLRMIFVRLCTPFVELGDHIPVVHARRDLARQNGQLRAENETLRKQVRALGELGQENIRLHELLNLKTRSPFRTLAARVISRDISNWWRSLQIDRGSDDGIHANMTVVNADGVVGKTISVTRSESRVLLLIDPGCKASALIQSSRDAAGIVAGTDTALRTEPRCQMMFVDRKTRIKAGDSVITSGLGGVFPKGIPIGTVAGARLNPQTGMYLDVEVKPAVDFHRLEEVEVIVE